VRTALTALLLLLAAPALAAPAGPQAEKKLAEGKLASARGDAKAARKAYEEALKLSPGYAEALNELGSLDFGDGDVKTAITRFQQAITADPQLPLPLYNLGVAYRKLGAYLDAVQSYRLYVSLKPSDPDGYWGLAESAFELGDRKVAMGAYKDYVARERRASEKPYVERSKARIEELEKKERQSAGTPGPPVIPVGGDRSLSVEKMKAGDQALASKKGRDALFLYQDALAADPQSPDALYRVGLAFASLGYLPEAVDRWERVAGAPSAAESLRQQARGVLERAQKQGLQVTMPATPRAAPPGPAPMPDAALAAYQHAVQLYGQKRYADAAAQFTAALAARPDLAYALVGRANAQTALGQLDAAAADLEKAAQMAPTSAAPLYSLGIVYERMGKKDRALDAFTRYVASTAADVDARLKADASSRAGRLR
jgi:tetratricopeptide (TPR) repeat protein